jgi:hypothetical protein
VIEADYFLNKSYIAQVLCINKEKPQKHCNGKCYLARQLKEQQKQDQQAAVAKKAKMEVQWCSLSASIHLNTLPEEKVNVYPLANLFQLFTFPHSVFRPPTV